MGEKITGAKIKNVYVKEGASAKGPWTRYDIYIEGDERKFAMFGGDKKPIPVQGMNIAFMEFDIVKSGEYTNYNVKALHTTDTSAPAQGPAFPAKEEPKKKFIDHGKSMIALMQMSIREGGIDKNILKEHLDIFKRGCDYINAPVKKEWTPPPSEAPVEEPPVQEEPFPFED